jgi:threonine/homoserine/homoserine lactone efflux protein
MGAAIGEVLGLAAGVAVSPLPVVAMILLLATPRGRVNGIMFGAGWLAGLAVLGAVVLLIAGPSDASSGGEPAAWVGWLKLVLGVLALLLAVRQWRSQPAEGAESSSSVTASPCCSELPIHLAAPPDTRTSGLANQLGPAHLHTTLDDAVVAFTAGERHTPPSST